MTAKDLGFLKQWYDEWHRVAFYQDLLSDTLDKGDTIKIVLERKGGNVDWELDEDAALALFYYYNNKREMYREGFKNTALSISENMEESYKEFQGGYVDLED